MGIAAAGIGMAQAAFDHAMKHLLSREAFGKKIGSFQHWQFRMAERATEIENARNLYLKAARRLDEGEAFPELEAAMAKHYATELSVDMARDAIQIMGGYGFLRELAADGSHYPVFGLTMQSDYTGHLPSKNNDRRAFAVLKTTAGEGCGRSHPITYTQGA